MHLHHKFEVQTFTALDYSPSPGCEPGMALAVCLHSVLFCESGHFFCHVNSPNLKGFGWKCTFNLLSHRYMPRGSCTLLLWVIFRLVDGFECCMLFQCVFACNLDLDYTIIARHWHSIYTWVTSVHCVTIYIDLLWRLWPLMASNEFHSVGRLKKGCCM